MVTEIKHKSLTSLKLEVKDFPKDRQFEDLNPSEEFWAYLQSDPETFKFFHEATQRVLGAIHCVAALELEQGGKTKKVSAKVILREAEMDKLAAKVAEPAPAKVKKETAAACNCVLDGVPTLVAHLRDVLAAAGVDEGEHYTKLTQGTAELHYIHYHDEQEQKLFQALNGCKSNFDDAAGAGGKVELYYTHLRKDVGTQLQRLAKELDFYPEAIHVPVPAVLVRGAAGKMGGTATITPAGYECNFRTTSTREAFLERNRERREKGQPSWIMARNGDCDVLVLAKGIKHFALGVGMFFPRMEGGFMVYGGSDKQGHHVAEMDAPPSLESMGKWNTECHDNGKIDTKTFRKATPSEMREMLVTLLEI